MNRNMILPATIAAGLHAMLLGFKPTKPTPAHEPTNIVMWVPPPMPPLEPEEVVQRVNIASDPAELPRPAPPRSPDIPHLVPENPAGPIFKSDLTPYTSGPNTSLIPGGIGLGSGDGLSNVIDRLALDNNPRALVRTSPNRPLGMNDADARVTVEFVVGKDGRVTNAQVVNSTNRALEESCLRAVRMWRFEPGIKHNLPVPFRMAQEFVFNTND
jgi:protein TonB